MEYKLSERGFQFIRSWEAYKAKPYTDMYGTTTIGYGHTAAMQGGKKIEPDEEYTLEKAEDQLHKDVEQVQNLINPILPPNLTQNQYDAVLSYAYNRGYGKFKKSDVYKALQNGNWDDVYELMKIDEKNRPGILNRRQSEANIWKDSNYTPVYPYSSKKSSSKKTKLINQSTSGGQVQSSDGAQVKLPTGERISRPTPKPSQVPLGNPAQSSNEVQVELPTGKRIPIPTPKPPQFSSSNPVQSSDGAQVELPTGENAPKPTLKPSWVPVPTQRPRLPTQNLQTLQPSAETPDNNALPQDIDWNTDFSSDSIGPHVSFGASQYNLNQNPDTQNNWLQSVREKPSFFGSLGNIFKRNPTEIQQQDTTQLSPNQQPSTQHRNVLKQLFDSLRFNILRGGSR